MPEIASQTRLRPFWGRLLILESPVDEEERPSGLIVPHHHEGQTVTITRGIVLHIDQSYHDAAVQWADYARKVETGTVVYFRNGVRLGDAYVVDIDDVLAFEADE